MSAQLGDYTGLIIAVTFLVSFFGLAGYMIKRQMGLDKERLSKIRLAAEDSLGNASAFVKEKEVVTQLVKVRCSNCGSLCVETESFCQNCGARI